MGGIKRMPVGCRCQKEKQREELEREQERAMAKELNRRLEKFRRYSLMNASFEASTFENWQLRDDNRILHDFARRYCEQWDIVKAENYGVLFHGCAGCGKTYAAFAIANELGRHGQTAMAISVSRIFRIIQDSYSRHGDMGSESEIEILNAISDVDLLVLDDLGVENKTHWAYEKLYSLIDARYQAKKPIIITTNFEIDALHENLRIIDRKSGGRDISDRIYNRVLEMCSFIKVKGESWRKQIGEKNKVALWRKLGLTDYTDQPEEYLGTEEHVISGQGGADEVAAAFGGRDYVHSGRYCGRHVAVNAIQRNSEGVKNIVVCLPLRDNTECPVTEEQRHEWAALYPAVNVIQQLRDMRKWLEDNPEKRKASADGTLILIANWLKKQQSIQSASEMLENVVELRRDRAAKHDD
jgi:DNA replication protein DnaC